jgi:hypothetical protein
VASATAHGDNVVEVLTQIAAIAASVSTQHLGIGVRHRWIADERSFEPGTSSPERRTSDRSHSIRVGCLPTSHALDDSWLSPVVRVGIPPSAVHFEDAFSLLLVAPLVPTPSAQPVGVKQPGGAARFARP